jgi:hypothetical protein
MDEMLMWMLWCFSLDYEDHQAITRHPQNNTTDVDARINEGEPTLEGNELLGSSQWPIL